MQNVHLLLGAQCSRYSARVRSYLIKKNIQYVERVPTAWTYLVSIRRRFSQSTLPVVIAPRGEWIVDSNLIIDRLEREYPQTPVLPTDPVQALFCMLADAWGSELWLPVDLGTRWTNRAQNYRWWREELGEGLFAGLPKALKNGLCDRTAGHFARYIELFGSEDPVIHDWLMHMMAVLDRHFAEHDYLLGARASRADFGLICPFYGHLARDPSSLPLLQDHPNLHAWVWRMQQPYVGREPPPFPPGGSPLPDTLQPVVESIFNEMLPLAEATRQSLQPHLETCRNGDKLPRLLDPVTHPLGRGMHRRAGTTILLWYLRRCRDLVASMPDEDAIRARDWLHRHGADGLLEIDLPRMQLLGGQTLQLVEA